MLYVRWRIMGTGPPAFTEVDNPASFADSLFVRVSCKLTAFLRVRKHGCLEGIETCCKANALYVEGPKARLG